MELYVREVRRERLIPRFCKELVENRSSNIDCFAVPIFAVGFDADDGLLLFNTSLWHKLQVGIDYLLLYSKVPAVGRWNTPTITPAYVSICEKFIYLLSRSDLYT